MSDPVLDQVLQEGEFPIPAKRALIFVGPDVLQQLAAQAGDWLAQQIDKACTEAVANHLRISERALTRDEIVAFAKMIQNPDGTRDFYWDDVPLLRFYPTEKKEDIGGVFRGLKVWTVSIRVGKLS